jgi:hypothetical protein
MTKLTFFVALVLLAGTTAAAQAQERPPLLTALPADAVSITEYYRQNVYDPGDQKIGSIIDIVVRKEGQVPAAIVSVGTFLLLRRKDVAVPFSAFELTYRNHKPYVILDTTKELLSMAPGMQYDEDLRRWRPIDRPFD